MSLIQVVSGDNFRIDNVVRVGLALEDLREFTKSFTMLSDVGELLSLEVDLSASGHRARLRRESVDFSHIEVAKGLASVHPVNAVERDLDLESLINIGVRRSFANNSDSRFESSSHDLVANLAHGYDSILKSLLEPSS